jgi:hypothetical protein
MLLDKLIILPDIGDAGFMRLRFPKSLIILEEIEKGISIDNANGGEAILHGRNGTICAYRN